MKIELGNSYETTTGATGYITYYEDKWIRWLCTNGDQDHKYETGVTYVMETTHFRERFRRVGSITFPNEFHTKKTNGAYINIDGIDLKIISMILNPDDKTYHINTKTEILDENGTKVGTMFAEFPCVDVNNDKNYHIARSK